MVTLHDTFFEPVKPLLSTCRASRAAVTDHVQNDGNHGNMIWYGGCSECTCIDRAKSIPFTQTYKNSLLVSVKDSHSKGALHFGYLFPGLHSVCKLPFIK